MIGQQRQSRAWVECWLRTGYVTNWRPELVYAPGPKVRLRECARPGGRLRPGDPRAGVEALLEAVASRR